jgi:calmodulin
VAQVDWDEFKSMFYRTRDDQTGYEPRKLFTVVDFIMHDKNASGSIDLDEAVTNLYQRFGKVGRACARSA